MFVSVSHLDFSYANGKPVLHDVSVSLDKGETLAIVGASGCGKSTLLRILSGILQPVRGSITIKGVNPDEYRKLGKLAFMFQESTLMPNLSVRDNIAFPLKIKGLRDEEKVEELIDAVGLSEFSGYLPSQLSGGMKTRVALARSFVTEPELLFLDEPFSALDIAWKSRLYLDLETLVDIYATTIIFVTHDVQEALLLSDDVLVLAKAGSVIKPIYKKHSKMSVSERVRSISEFSSLHTYQTNFIAIQKALINDGVRSITGVTEVDPVLERVIEASRNGGKRWASFFDDLTSIRSYSNNPRVFKVLLDAFRTESTSDFKYGLVWDILHFDQVPEAVRSEVREFYLKNLDTFTEFTWEFYGAAPETLFDILLARIGLPVEKCPRHKKFIYLCDLYHSSEHARVNDFLDDVIAGEIHELDDAFGKETAVIMKKRIASKAAHLGMELSK